MSDLDEANKEIERLRAQLDAQSAAQAGWTMVARMVINELRSRGVMLPISVTPQEGNNVGTIAAKYARMGKDFDTLMDHIKRDTMLASEWERFCMMLRLAE